jgi:ABC-2 type transport system permease protein
VHEMLIVLQREFVERVRTKSFVISTLLFPVFMAAIFVVPILMGGGSGGENRLALASDAPAAVTESVVTSLEIPPATERGASFVVERVEGSFEEQREALYARMAAGELDGVLYLPADIAETSTALYRGRNVTNMQATERLQRATSEAVQAVRLRDAGLEVTEVAALLRPVRLESARVTRAGEEGGSAVGSFILAYIIAFLLYMLIAIYGNNVMRSVLEEKTSRISEVLISSMRAPQLMAGKVIGVSSVVLFQVVIWAALAAIVLSQSNLLIERFNLPPQILSTIRVEPGVLLLLLLYFVLGFFLYAAIFAAVGAAVTSEQEAQQFAFFPMMPLIVPMLFLAPITSDPTGSTATVMGWLPFTSPIVMPMRMAATDIPLLEVLGSLALLVATVWIVSWVAGKIYRIGILSTGKRPSLRELALWMRTA